MWGYSRYARYWLPAKATNNKTTNNRQPTTNNQPPTTDTQHPTTDNRQQNMGAINSQRIYSAHFLFSFYGTSMDYFIISSTARSS